MTRRSRLATAAIAALAVAGPAIAQDANNKSTTRQDETMQEQMVLTEEKLESFVDAALDVQGVTESFAPRAEAVESDADRQALAEEANTAIRGAIEETPGITIEEYVAIGQAAQQNPELAQRITMMAQEKASTSDDG